MGKGKFRLIYCYLQRTKQENKTLEGIAFQQVLTQA
jgi:hypothetical protein